MHTFRTLIPAFTSFCAWRFLNSVTVAIGFNPAFSANVYGITSSASANARIQYWWTPDKLWAYSAKRTANSISGAAPPAINALELESHFFCYLLIRLQTVL